MKFRTTNDNAIPEELWGHWESIDRPDIGGISLSERNVRFYGFEHGFGSLCYHYDDKPDGDPDNVIAIELMPEDPSDSDWGRSHLQFLVCQGSDDEILAVNSKADDKLKRAAGRVMK